MAVGRNCECSTRRTGETSSRARGRLRPTARIPKRMNPDDPDLSQNKAGPRPLERRPNHELHRDSRLMIYTVDADTRPVVALDTVDISLDRLSDADFEKAQALIEDIRHPGALKAWYRELVNNDSEDNRGYVVRLGNNNAADSYLCDVFRGAASSAPAAVGKLDSLVRRAAGLPARKI